MLIKDWLTSIVAPPGDLSSMMAYVTGVGP